MYIAPNTTIKILRDVPCDIDYNNTLYFASKDAQASYFDSKAKYTLQNNSYQRVDNNTMRINLLSDNIYDCNYLMFMNENYGNKRFYAFITGIDYVNNITCNVHYTIDVIQTYMFDWSLEQCYIERMHTRTDGLAENYIDEGLPVGEMIYSNLLSLSWVTASNCVAVEYLEENGLTGNVYDGIWGGTRISVWNVGIENGRQGFADWLERKFLETPENLVNMYMIPNWVVEDGDGIPSWTFKTLSYSAKGYPELESYLPLTGTEDFGGYVPRNKKVYMYPYNYPIIYTSTGKVLKMRYEFFPDLTPRVRFTSCIASPVSITCRPFNYKGIYTDQLEPTDYPLFTEGINLTDFPICSWNFDTYKAYCAQTNATMGYDLGGSLLSSLFGGFSAGSLWKTTGSGADDGYAKGTTDFSGQGVVGSLSSYVGNKVKGLGQAQIAPDILGGNIASGNPDISNDDFKFYFSRVHLNAQMAKIIDDYFTMFGYAIHSIGKPSIHNRSGWTYIKTVNAGVRGSVPADEVKRIQNIFDKGITFWVNPENVGNYDIANTPLGA